MPAISANPSPINRISNILRKRCCRLWQVYIVSHRTCGIASQPSSRRAPCVRYLASNTIHEVNHRTEYGSTGRYLARGECVAAVCVVYSESVGDDGLLARVLLVLAL